MVSQLSQSWYGLDVRLINYKQRILSIICNEKISVAYIAVNELDYCDVSRVVYKQEIILLLKYLVYGQFFRLVEIVHNQVAAL